MNNKITLIGAGLAGSLLAIYLAKRGMEIEIYECRPDMRETQIGAGRSINLALSTRGIYALKDVGIYDDIMKIAIPMKGRMMHAVDGGLTFQRYGKDDTEVIYAISRAQLNMLLMDEAEKYDGCRIAFNEKCIGMNLKTGDVKLRNKISGKTTEHHTHTVIATDGSGSAIRQEMLKTKRFNYSQDYLDYGYKELTIPADPQGKFQLDKNALHIWPRHTFMLIALPNLDASFTCTLFLPFEDAKYSFENLNSEDKLLDFFQEQFHDAIPLIPTLAEDFFSNPTGALVTIRCNPWHIGNKAVLLGDAAHAVVPFFGQGMNCAFEDCTYLDECIATYGTDWEKTFREFEKLRIENANAIADLALENFIEMRDRVADPQFLLKKNVERVLEEKYPEVFIPKYSMVTFRRIPYSVAKFRGKVQDQILAELCETIKHVDELDWNKADSLMQNLQHLSR